MTEAGGTPRPRMAVEDVFREPGDIQTVAGAPDGFHALSMFDHPETLVAQEASGGMFLIFRRGEENIVKLKKLITAEVLQGIGHSYSESANLSMQEILDLRAEVGRRLQAELAGLDLE
jgi:hypothetical protein